MRRLAHLNHPASYNELLYAGSVNMDLMFHKYRIRDKESAEKHSTWSVAGW